MTSDHLRGFVLSRYNWRARDLISIAVRTVPHAVHSDVSPVTWPGTRQKLLVSYSHVSGTAVISISFVSCMYHPVHCVFCKRAKCARTLAHLMTDCAKFCCFHCGQLRDEITLLSCHTRFQVCHHSGNAKQFFDKFIFVFFAALQLNHHHYDKGHVCSYLPFLLQCAVLLAQLHVCILHIHKNLQHRAI